MAGRIVLRLAAGATLADVRSDMPSGVRTALLGLEGEGATEEELLAAASSSAASLPLLYYALHDLARRNLLVHCAMGSRPLASVTGSALLARAEWAAGTAYTFSKAAFIRRSGEEVVIESAVSSVQVKVHDARVLSLMADPDPAACGLTPDESAALLTLLLRCGIVTKPGAEESGTIAYWEFPDLLFHGRTRIGRHLGRYGGTYALKDRYPAPPCVKAPMSEESFELATPDLERLQGEDVPFTRVIEGRRSTRTFGEQPMARGQLGEFLYRTARQRATLEVLSGQELGSRPYPGGGAIYELELYLAIGACDGLPRGFYHYHPGQHRLYKLPTGNEVVEDFLRSARESSGSRNPQVVLAIAARFDRFFWKYESIRYAAILKNVGALYQTLYLVAEAMGLGACALGGGDAESLSTAAGLDYYTESAVGEFMIGSRVTA
jgi:SagB-type dehydrogenase family enzyme